MLRVFIILLIFMSCNTGKLTIVNDLPNDLKEVSAVEKTIDSDLIWIIEDAGNKNNLYALDKDGKLVKDIDIDNADNDDWEDITSDHSGNIYIGDFGNNSKKREKFTIYKVVNPKLSSKKSHAESINFKLPKDMKSQDFEAFFLHNNQFYLFSKDDKETILIKIPNQIGNHTATRITKFNLKGKDNAITSADISDDGKTVVLLNHDKLWKLSDYTSDNFFTGSVKEQKFEHYSQKEGVCFKGNNVLYITDERKGGTGGNLYTYNLN